MTVISLDAVELSETVRDELREHPILTRVEHVAIIPIFGDEPNWDVSGFMPSLTQAELPHARQIVEILRLRYRLADE